MRAILHPCRLNLTPLGYGLANGNFLMSHRFPMNRRMEGFVSLRSGARPLVRSLIPDARCWGSFPPRTASSMVPAPFPQLKR